MYDSYLVTFDLFLTKVLDVGSVAILLVEVPLADESETGGGVGVAVLVANAGDGVLQPEDVVVGVQVETVSDKHK